MNRKTSALCDNVIFKVFKIYEFESESLLSCHSFQLRLPSSPPTSFFVIINVSARVSFCSAPYNVICINNVHLNKLEIRNDSGNYMSSHIKERLPPFYVPPFLLPERERASIMCQYNKHCSHGRKRLLQCPLARRVTLRCVCLVPLHIL